MTKRRKRGRGSPIALSTDNEKGSFSRFVLPFSWRREPCADRRPDTALKWTALPEAKFCERYGYFTRDTGSALYQRARWFRLSGFDKQPWATGQTVVLPDGREITARMNTPGLVLFEWNNKDQKHELLQTGFLIVDLFLQPGPDGAIPTLDDLLLVNEFFRYIDCPWPDHYHTSQKPCFRHLFLKARSSFIKPDAPAFDHDSFEEPGSVYFNRWADLLSLPLEESENTLCRVVSDKKIDDARNYLANPVSANDPGFLVYADNRTYVWTAASLKKGVSGLQQIARSGSMRASDYGHWIKLLNVDTPEKTPSQTHHAVRDFERQWADERTYKRWEEWGTWYGFSYHSGVALMKAPENPPNFVEHFSCHYFDIALLLFYLRVSLFRFSNALGELSKDKNMQGDDFSHIRNAFARFTMRYQFPILSNQQQALEMYELARKHFDVDDMYNEVKAEIHETHEYLDMLDSRDLNQIANKIALIGLPLAAGGLVAGALSAMSIGSNSLNLFDCVFGNDASTCTWNRESLTLGALVVALSVLFGLFIRLRVKFFGRGSGTTNNE